MELFGLTIKQKKVLDFIICFIDENGYSPTHGEIADHMNWASKGNAHRCICSLEERGYIRRIANFARCIDVNRDKLNLGLKDDLSGLFNPSLLKRISSCAEKREMSVREYVVDAVLNFVEVDSE